MLVAHLVPGYLAAVNSRPYWKPDWNRPQQVVLWIAALGSTIAPDLDLIYNSLFHGFSRHSTFGTHSLFVPMGIGLCWWLLRRIGRWPYLQTLVGLVAVGGLSHWALDVVSQSTPLLYPMLLYMVGAPSKHALEGSVWGYMTDPIFLSEPFLLALAAVYWLARRKPAARIMKLAMFGLVSGLAAFTAIFLLLLPALHSIITM